jgi:hypothetical protein
VFTSYSGEKFTAGFNATDGKFTTAIVDSGGIISAAMSPQSILILRKK